MHWLRPSSTSLLWLLAGPGCAASSTDVEGCPQGDAPVCGADEVAWVSVGPHGCETGRVPAATVELQHDVDGDVHQVVFGPEGSDAVRLHLPGGVVFADQLAEGVGWVDAVSWSDADAQVAWDGPLDDNAVALQGQRVSGTLELSGGEVVVDGEVVAADDVEGAGCFDGEAVLAGYFP